jgi:hypothetical protein
MVVLEVNLGNRLNSALILIPFAAMVIFAAGCGALNPSNNGTGGGTSAPGAAQGVYVCSMTNGETLVAFITPGDVLYGIHGPGTGSLTSVSGLLTGQGASETSSYSGTFTDFLSGSKFTNGLTATDVPGSSISGAFTENALPIGFGGAAPLAADYSYTTAASVASIASTWGGSLLDGTLVSLNISPTGVVTTNTTTGCSVAGNITANSSLKNFFDVSLMFTGTSCAFDKQTGTGQGLYYMTPGATTHQLLLAVTVSTTAGTVFFAQK